MEMAPAFRIIPRQTNPPVFDDENFIFGSLPIVHTCIKSIYTHTRRGYPDKLGVSRAWSLLTGDLSGFRAGRLPVVCSVHRERKRVLFRLRRAFGAFGDPEREKWTAKSPISLFVVTRAKKV